MSTSTAQVLMRKGKRGAAAYIHADCAGGSPQHLGSLLDVLLNPSKAIDEWETIDWCRWLIAGGRTPDEFAAIVRSYDNHDKCGLVWIPHVVAYRCRTCGISPCMSICSDCFRRGDHSTHDFNMFLSQAGGACDCGDKSVMKEDGFCSNHGHKCSNTQSPAPADLMCVAEAMMPRVILRLLQHFRENSWGVQANSDTYRIAVQECEGYISMLMEFNNMGELMRKAMTKALINLQMYRNLVEPPFAETEYGCYMAESKKMYEEAIRSFPTPKPPSEYAHLPALGEKLVHATLLEEFIFWTFKYEFPQNVVCFLLKMLPDQDYKEHLTRTFVMHYARIPLVLEESGDPDTLSNRVVHMSVQLFSNEALALRMVQQLHLLHVMVVSLRCMMDKIVVQNTLHDRERNSHRVIDCAQRVMKEHCYWPLVSDFNNVLSHKSVALVFLEDNSLITMWFEFLSMLQGMNVNVRELGSHIEYEPSSYYAAFSCELEAAAYPMWSVIAHLTGPQHARLAQRIVMFCLDYLQDWLAKVHFTLPNMQRTEIMHASFHFPLHRYLAAFLGQAMRVLEVKAEDILPPLNVLSLLVMHPLRVQVSRMLMDYCEHLMGSVYTLTSGVTLLVLDLPFAWKKLLTTVLKVETCEKFQWTLCHITLTKYNSLFYEILSGIWVRNGLQIKGQAMTYIQANFCNSMVDMDIYFLQVCAAHLPKDQFIYTCVDVFGVREWLSMSHTTPTQELEQEAMIDGLLTFLAVLVSSRTNLGNDELTQSRLEISTLLATADRTHSQLLELMPERSGNAHTRNFETVLKELSTYRPPPKGSENLEQGLFVPKPEVWERHYDPLHVLQRAVHRRDFQNSMDRFTAYIQDSQKQKEQTDSTASSASASSSAPAAPPKQGSPVALWPPLRRAAPPPAPHADPRAICDAGPLHAALLAVLHRAVHRGARAAPPEHVVALAVFLLEVAVDRAIEAAIRDKDKSPMCQYGSSHTRGDYPEDVPLLDSFPGDSICENARAVLAGVALLPPAKVTPGDANYPTAYNSDSDTEWDASEAEQNMSSVPSVVRRPPSLPHAAAAPRLPSTALALPRSLHVALPTLDALLPVPAPVAMETAVQDVEDRVARRRRILSETDHDEGDTDALQMHEFAMEDDDDDDDYPIRMALPPAEAANQIVNVITNSRQNSYEDTSITAMESLPQLMEGPAPTLSSSSSGDFDSPGLGRGGVGGAGGALSRHDGATHKRQGRGSVNSPSFESIQINESLLSLLLKLHSQLSGRLDSFSLDEGPDEEPYRSTFLHEQPGPSTADTDAADVTGSESRIGDGPFFIGNLLRKLATLDVRCAAAIADIRRRLWPHQRERQAEQKARERKEKEERSRRARERQQRLMQDFARRQNQFMDVIKAMETEEGVGMDWREEEEVLMEKEYDCVICNTTSPSTDTNPMGLVVLLQSTSVLGHRRHVHSPPATLPLSDRDRAHQAAAHAHTDPTLAADHYRKQEELDQQFDIESWLLSVSVGWEGGVHVQSCGHHLHLHCLQAYLRSLTNPQRPHNLHIERGEFLCPVCRQLANSVFPLSPQLGRISTLARCPPPDMPTLATDIYNFLKDHHHTPTTSNLSEAMGKAMEDITSSTRCKFKHSRPLGTAAPDTHLPIFTFITSVARTNLEAELVQRGGSLVMPAKPARYKPRKDCMVPLLHLLSMHARVLAQWPVAEAWHALCSPSSMASGSVSGAGVAGGEMVATAAGTPTRPVPLLLRDPLALLTQFVLLVPLNLEMSYYTCTVRTLYNLTYYQVVAQLAAGMTAEGRASLVAASDHQPQGLRRAARLLLGALAGSELFTEDGPPGGGESSEEGATETSSEHAVDVLSLELQLQELCLPFLRTAALLRHHLYGEELPDIRTRDSEFVRLVYYLELVTEGMELSSFDASRALQWAWADSGERAVRSWARQLGSAAARCQIAVRRLLRTHHVAWTPPRLLRLPREYDRLFTYYHERVCSQCGAVPKESSVCLLCGTIVCLKQHCCRQQDVCEAVQHAMECGGGTGIFLVVTSTYIIVIRGRRACLWGSLYLDDYDEEDRDLKRGKPLYLSEDRFELLESQWLAHRFDHTKRTWVWHRDSL